MTFMAMPQRKNFAPTGGHERYNFGRPFLVHHYYIHSLSDLCLGVEKKIFKEIIHFHHVTFMTTSQPRIPAPEVMKFTILVDPPLVSITTYLVCLIFAWEQKRRLYKKYINFTLFTPELPPLVGGGHEIYNFLSPYPTDTTYQIWLLLARRFLRRRC